MDRYYRYFFFFFFHKEEHIVFSFLLFWEVTKDTTDFINFIEKKKGEKPNISCFDGRHKSSFKYTTKRGY